MNVERCSVVGLIVMTMSRYGYIEEYKKLIDTLKIALTECWKIIINDSESSKMEKLAAVGRSNETIARLQSIYQYNIRNQEKQTQEDSNNYSRTHFQIK